MIDAGRLAGYDPRTGRTTTPDDVVADLDRLGIAVAWVASSRCLHQDLRAGNAEAVAWATGAAGRLAPLAIVQPAYYGASADVLVGEAVEAHGAVAVAVHGGPFLLPDEWRSPAVRAIGEAAARRGVPVQAVLSTPGELAGVVDGWGGLDTEVMIRWASGHRYRAVGAELVAARRHPALRFDVGNAASVGLIELLVAELGAERLFLATNAPDAISDCSVALLRTAAISDDDRATIARGPAVPSSATAAVAPDVDTHWHHDHWNLGEPAVEPAVQEAALDRFGTTVALTSSVEALTYDLESGNRSAADWCGAHPRWRAYVVVDPHRPDASVTELRRWLADERFVGAKTIQDTHGMRLDDERYEPILDAVAEAGVPLLCHLTGVGEAAARHPDVTFVAAHADWQRARHLAAHTNIAFDFSTSSADAASTRLADFVDLVGAHRVLFGSDGPLISPAWSLAKLGGSGIGRREQAAILGENARRMFTRLAAGTPR